ncbi:nucleotidyltransferase family protein [Candidatus Woesearchaeota archaeon]|nr:nucleotidyltransferase family protein [Candidatus Woesearchaeota archaeon]
MVIHIEAIVLAAGYATRLYPLTENIPKPLLNVAGKPILEHIIRKLEVIPAINKIYIVTNDKFEQHFRKWLENFDSERPIEVINDGTKTNEDRLGALGDIHHIISLKNIDDEILVVAGDNLFEQSLIEVFNFFKKRKSNVIVLHDVKDFDLAKHYGIVEVSNNLVVNFEEKPVSPKSTLASTVIYFFPKKTISLIKKYISQGNNPDKTGSFIEWLHKREKVYSYITDKKWYDIGSIEQLKKADKHYKQK